MLTKVQGMTSNDILAPIYFLLLYLLFSPGQVQHFFTTMTSSELFSRQGQAQNFFTGQAQNFYTGQE